MLILTRKPDEAIVIGDNVVIKVIRIQGNQVQIGISAPPEVPVHRQEIYDLASRANRAAAVSREAVSRLPLFQAAAAPAAPPVGGPATPLAGARKGPVAEAASGAPAPRQDDTAS